MRRRSYHTGASRKKRFLSKGRSSSGEGTTKVTKESKGIQGQRRRKGRAYEKYNDFWTPVHIEGALLWHWWKQLRQLHELGFPVSSLSTSGSLHLLRPSPPFGRGRHQGLVTVVSPCVQTNSNSRCWWPSRSSPFKLMTRSKASKSSSIEVSGPVVFYSCGPGSVVKCRMPSNIVFSRSASSLSREPRSTEAIGTRQPLYRCMNCKKPLS